MTAFSRQVPQRVTDYLVRGGLWNPELADHDAVRDLLIDARDCIEILARVWADYARHKSNCQRSGRHQCTCGFTEINEYLHASRRAQG